MECGSSLFWNISLNLSSPIVVIFGIRIFLVSRLVKCHHRSHVKTTQCTLMGMIDGLNNLVLYTIYVYYLGVNMKIRRQISLIDESIIKCQ